MPDGFSSSPQGGAPLPSQVLFAVVSILTKTLYPHGLAHSPQSGINAVFTSISQLGGGLSMVKGWTTPVEHLTSTPDRYPLPSAPFFIIFAVIFGIVVIKQNRYYLCNHFL